MSSASKSSPKISGINNITPIVLLFGGTGNRLFQIARAWDLKNVGQCPQVLDIEEVPEILWLLNNALGWVRHPAWLNTTDLCKFMGLERAKPSLRNRVKIYTACMRLLFSNRREKLNISRQKDHRSVQIGYFQAHDCISEESVSATVTTISNMLNLTRSIEPEAVVHIRGGDFALKDRLSSDEVVQFMKFQSEAICVTNDIKYVKRHYPDLKVSSSLDASADFTIIAKATYILPSNSTFCFWACAVATLNNNAKISSRPSADYWNLLPKQ